MVQPAFVAPFVLAITHPDGVDANGRIFEVGAGFIAEIRWERSKGQFFKTDKTFTPSAVSTVVLLERRLLRNVPHRCKISGSRSLISTRVLSSKL